MLVTPFIISFPYDDILYFFFTFISKHYRKFIYSFALKLNVKACQILSHCDAVSIFRSETTILTLRSYKFCHSSLHGVLLLASLYKFPVLFGTCFFRRFMSDIGSFQTPEKVVDLFLKVTICGFSMKS